MEHGQLVVLHLKFGVVIVMSFETGRILDFEVLSKYCHQCKLHQNDDKTSAAYMEWQEDYYGKAIRGNIHDVTKMNKAVWAIYYHTISTNSKPQHSYCPMGTESWCTYNQEAAKGKEEEYRHT